MKTRPAMPRFARLSAALTILTVAVVLIMPPTTREDPGFAVRFAGIEMMDIGLVTSGMSNHLTPLEFAVLHFTNSSDRAVMIQNTRSEVQEGNAWRDILRFQSRPSRTVPPHSSLRLNVQAVEDRELWRMKLYVAVQVPLFERIRMRVRDAWRMGSVANLAKPWWRTVVVTNVYKREGTNLIAPEMFDTKNTNQRTGTN